VQVTRRAGILPTWGLALVTPLAGLTILSGCAASEPASSESPVSELREKYPRQIDLANAQADCLRKKGWSVAVDQDGSFGSNFPDDQRDDYNRDSLACQKAVGIDPDLPTPTYLVRQQYKDFLQGASCLRKLGWPISKAPTLATFEDTYESDPWIPWDEVPQDDEFKALKHCPFPEATY
jgi:hypothetical protein